MNTNLKYGMVGGGLGAMIGEYHRRALSSEKIADLTAGCFSSKEEKNLLSGQAFHIPEDRIYADYRTMAEEEAKREDGIAFVVIVTPNVTHYEIAKAFLQQGIHVMCEKPLCFTIEQAEELQSLAAEKKLYFRVAYTYTGYDMVRLARKLVVEGEIGQLLNVRGTFFQDWMLDMVKTKGNTPEAMWRVDPARSGISNCVGDIGTHIESVISYITGRKPERVSAVLDHFGMELDVNANMLVEYEGGLHGSFACSQVYSGAQQGIAVSIWGTEGMIEWSLTDFGVLRLTRNGRTEVISLNEIESRKGIVSRKEEAASGADSQENTASMDFMEGFAHAFANLYHGFAGKILEQESTADYADVEAGINGVRFVHAAVESTRRHGEWICMRS